MRVGPRRGSILLALLLLVGVLATTGTASGVPVPPATIQGKIDSAAAGCIPFDSTRTVWVETFNTSLDRFTTTALPTPNSKIDDGSGLYEVRDLPPGEYKLRVKVYGASGSRWFEAYWWYNAAEAAAPRYEDGDLITLGEGATVTLDFCMPGFTGGSFRGKVTSDAGSLEPECWVVQPYEAASGISVGYPTRVQNTGFYRYGSDLPAGDYKVLIHPADDPGCPPVPRFLHQWWHGHSAADMWAYADPPMIESGGEVTIGNGSWTNGIRFDLVEIGTCRGLTPTILGTTADDTINGTPGDDVIRTFAGDDLVYGMYGDDVVCTDRGNDHVWGGPGKDVILTGWNDDWAYGNDDRDRLILGGGTDWGYGGDQGDLIKGGNGTDYIYGDNHNDRLIGGAGEDWAGGGRGTDYCDVEHPLIDCENPL